jgi:hypothetical protein
LSKILKFGQQTAFEIVLVNPRHFHKSAVEISKHFDPPTPTHPHFFGLKTCLSCCDKSLKLPPPLQLQTTLTSFSGKKIS